MIIKNLNNHSRFIFLGFTLINFLIFAGIGCKEKKPELDKSVTESYTPKEGVLPYFKGEIMDPFWSETKTLPSDLRKFSEINLTTHTNSIFTEKNLLGKYTLLIFFYAKCHKVCPMITKNMVDLLPKIKNQTDLQIISISVNPDEDTVDVIKQYRERFKITNPNWFFLTGSKQKIYLMARTQFGADVKVVKDQDNLDDFVHTENVFLLDKQNYLRGVYRAKGTGDLERLLIELETLRKER
ncbi:MAG: SCO family protein [Leptospiraceae bacterium]|nr:SCO family protein [Leptospiraceae bacterium]